MRFLVSIFHTGFQHRERGKNSNEYLSQVMNWEPAATKVCGQALTHIHTRTHTRTPMLTHIHTHTHTHTHTHGHTHTHTHTHMLTHNCSHTHAHTHAPRTLELSWFKWIYEQNYFTKTPKTQWPEGGANKKCKFFFSSIWIFSRLPPTPWAS